MQVWIFVILNSHRTLFISRPWSTLQIIFLSSPLFLFHRNWNAEKSSDSFLGADVGIEPVLPQHVCPGLLAWLLCLLPSLSNTISIAAAFRPVITNSVFPFFKMNGDQLPIADHKWYPTAKWVKLLVCQKDGFLWNRKWAGQILWEGSAQNKCQSSDLKKLVAHNYGK